jgi:hypothetical protein
MSNPLTDKVGCAIARIKQTVDHSEKFSKLSVNQPSIA